MKKNGKKILLPIAALLVIGLCACTKSAYGDYAGGPPPDGGGNIDGPPPGGMNGSPGGASAVNPAEIDPIGSVESTVGGSQSVPSDTSAASDEGAPRM